jgi:imidazolonepropionase-like amidohydrolase
VSRLPYWFGTEVGGRQVKLIVPAHEKTAVMLRTMQSEGVGLLAGTDCSWSNPYTFPGWTLHQELELLVKCGLSPMEVLQMATRNPARFLGELDNHGTVEGKQGCKSRRAECESSR